MTIATELHHVAHLGHDVYEQCPACRAAIMIGMGATVAAVIYGGGDADTLVKWVGTFTTMSEADAYCQTKADAYPGMSVLIVDEFGSYDDGRISPITATFPAYASDTLGETITLTYPAGWADRVAAIVPVLSYGPNYSRAAIESLNDMSRCVRDDYSTVAYDYLLSAERAARRNGIDIPELNS